MRTGASDGTGPPAAGRKADHAGAAELPAPAGPDIVVRGRHTEVSERFRVHAAGKLARMDKLDHKLIRLDVEVSRESNPRLSAQCDRVEITCIGRGPVIRAEAAAQDAYAALDAASAKLEERLRRAADRRHSRGARVARVAPVNGIGPGRFDPAPVDSALTGADGRLLEGDDDGPFVVREKVHPEVPMTLDEALASMELVGHDFYLFTDAETGCPSVVYRRRGYHYGVLRLGAARPVGRGGRMSPDTSR